MDLVALQPYLSTAAEVRVQKGLLDLDIQNPQFSLNEAFSRRMAASMAETLGMSIQGVAEGVGMLGRKGAEAMGGTAKGIGDAIGGLFGAQKK